MYSGKVGFCFAYFTGIFPLGGSCANRCWTLLADLKFVPRSGFGSFFKDTHLTLRLTVGGTKPASHALLRMPASIDCGVRRGGKPGFETRWRCDVQQASEATVGWLPIGCMLVTIFELAQAAAPLPWCLIVSLVFFGVEICTGIQAIHCLLTLVEAMYIDQRNGDYDIF